MANRAYVDDPFCSHGFDEGCSECDATPAQLAAGPAFEPAPLSLVDRGLRKPRRRMSYQEWSDTHAPVDDGPADNYGGW